MVAIIIILISQNEDLRLTFSMSFFCPPPPNSGGDPDGRRVQCDATQGFRPQRAEREETGGAEGAETRQHH